MALATLSIDLEARLTKLQQGLDKAGRIAEKDSARIAKAFDGARAAAASIGGALVAGLSITAVTQFVKGSIDGADAAIKQARAVGVLTEEITALNFAAELSGVSQEELNGGLQRLARNAKDAGDGVKESVEAFGQLGISVKGSDGQLKNTSDLLGEVADRFAALPDGIQKTAIAQELFGRSGAKLINLLNGGSAGLQSFREEAEKAGLVIGTETAEAAEQLNDNITRLKKNLEGFGNSIAAVLIPELNELVSRIIAARDTFESFGDFLASDVLASNNFSDVGQGVEFFTAKVALLRGQLDQLGDDQGYRAQRFREKIQGDISDAQKLLEYYQRIASATGQLGAGGGRGFINPSSAVQQPSVGGGGGGGSGGGGKEGIPFAITDPANEQLVNFLRSEKDAYAEIDAYIKSATERAQELGTAITDPIEQIKADFLASEKAAYDITDADVAALLANIEQLDDRTKQFLENAQDALGDTLLDTFKGTTDGILERWGNLLLRLVADAAAADLVGALTGSGDTGNLASLGDAIGELIGSVFGGGRAIGGPARRGQIVEVNELGGPGELFSAGGKQYLLPSADGIVTPSAQRPGYYGGAAGGGGGVQNNIIIQAPPGSSAQTSERSNGTGGIDTLIKILDQRMAAGVRGGGSQTARAFQETYGVSRASGAPRRG